MNQFSVTNRSWLSYLIGWPALTLGLLLVALVSHLGYLPLDTSSDEPRRALVAIEMMLSGDYITPTLNGELYFNKPPLYNWFIVLFYRFFDNYSSFTLRLPMVVSILLLGVTVFSFVRRYIPVRADKATMVAFVVAMMVLTNGRVLIYDSLWSSIDFPFAWLTYLAMMLVYHFDRRQKYWALFLSTYALTALGFLTKGLPAVVFQGLTLLSWFIYTRQFRRLFHPAHFVGIGLFLLITGCYYAAYFSRNHIPLTSVASVLFDESAKRTVVTFGVGETLLHLLTFPFEMIYHFVPYLLLLILLFRRGNIKRLRQEPFIAFNTVVFLANVVVYWSSPQVYARYLIGLLPLLFTVLAYCYYEQSEPTQMDRKWVERIWLGSAMIVTAGCWVALFHPKTSIVEGITWKVTLIFMLLAISTWWLWQDTTNRLARMLLVMVVVRIGINWITLPGRLASRQFYKNESERIARKTMGSPLYSYRETIYNSSGAADVNSFHITALRGEILRKTNRKLPNAYYIADSASLQGERYETIDTICLFNKHPAKLVRFLSAD
ncbi:ArnT family glycosyltransferase [Spirosoma oryzicola]|uniref:ArnT family glycosyltransferase n=1 Tax=Spirosoma oryzicola TaxID=2898794 RepID=UPI001E5038BC|nr:glycosyltransferase family 39 protein [Spirosoma oryzicola]UHG90070.1 glycosyltransferase family 39 protein [Spirosoma oryzicola]